MSFKVGCFGYGGTVAIVEQFREELQLNGIELRTCHEYANATVPYNKDVIYSFIDACDIIILPSRAKLQPAKSVNRLALALSRKKACVVSPLDAYLRYVKDGESVLIAETKEEWLSAIFKLRDDQVFRDKIAQSGHIAGQTLHPIHQIEKLVKELNKKEPQKTWPADAFVQIIIPHYADRLDYLTLAVKAAVESHGPDRDVLVISSSKVDPTESLAKYKNVRVIHQNNRLSFSQANNLGIKNADQKTTHYLLLNDDTILSNKALGLMVMRICVQGNTCILNPHSNCDKGWLHQDVFVSNGIDLHPNMVIEQFTSDQLLDLFKFPQNPDGSLNASPFCAFYCTLIPKEIVTKIGFLNTLFKNGGEDLDYCERAKRYGYSCYWTRDAFCFHFGGKTRTVAENEDKEQYHKEDIENNVMAKKRWGNKKKRIAIWTGPAWEKWDLDSYRTSGIGGSETCAGRLAQVAAEAGHSVTLYGAHDCKEQYGVQLIPWNSFIPEEEYFDLFIASRNVNCIDERLRAKKILVWVHDIWLLSGQEVSEYHRNKVDKFVCLSPWHEDFFSNHHKIPKDKITIIPNGINVELFGGLSFDNKKYGNLIYSSSPDRGLDNLIYCMIFARDQVPELHLDVYYGFHNYESSVRSRNNADEVRRLDELKEVIEKHSDFVTMHGRVSQGELAKKWAAAYAWVYPTLFTETSCCINTTQISMADGTYKKIPNVVEGDIVKTHNGIGKVTKTMQRNAKEHIYKIKIKNLKDPLEITGEHPVLALTYGDNKCGRSSRFCKKSYSYCTHYEYKDKKTKLPHVLNDPCSRLSLKFEPKWINASSLKKGDMVCITKNKNKNEPPFFKDILYSNVFGYRDQHKIDHFNTNQIKDFKVDKEFLEFCGWYLAEGNFDGKSIVTFSLHMDEIVASNFIKSQITRLGLTFREDLKQDTHCRVIVTHSVILGQFFASFGRISKDRCLPKWIKDLDTEYLQFFLRGFYHGDGCEILNTARAEGASNNLVYDLFEVLLKFSCLSYTANSKKKKPVRNGKVICHSETEVLPAFLIGTSMTQNKGLFKFFGYSPNEDGNEKSYIEDDNYVYLPITKIEKYDFDGDVYNFEVEGDNSYIANGVVIHNCITAKEAQLSKTPVVCSNIAALQTTVGEFGHLVRYHPYSREARMEVIDQIVRLHKDKDYWVEMSERSYRGSKNISWDDIWGGYWSKWA